MRIPNNLSEAVANLVRQKIDLRNAKLRPEHFYASLPLCIMDAVFSIGVKYTGTRQTVIRWAEAQVPAWPLYDRGISREHTVSDAIEAMAPYSSEELAERFFKNRQRTSTKNGILKSEAVRRFAVALRESGIEKFADIQEHRLEKAEALIKEIPGQGISFDYFTLLAGNQMVKADRMIIRFVAEATGLKKVMPQIAKDATIGAVRLLSTEFPHLDTRLLDSEVWSYESKKAATRSLKKSISKASAR